MQEIQVGQRFTRLVVLGEATEEPASKGKHYRVRCDCGTEFVTARVRLINGTCRSCGCLRKEHCKTMKHKTRQFIEYNGETHSAREWAEITGISIQTIRARYFRNHKRGAELLSKTDLRTGKEIIINEKTKKDVTKI